MTTLGKTQTYSEINFLCVHKQLRHHRLAPVLIKEITRRVNLCDIWQAIYTSGTTLPTPFGSATYWHRNLNPQKTVDVGFAFKPQGKTMPSFIKMHRLPEKAQIEGMRPMKERDVKEVAVLLNEHLKANYKVHVNFTEEEVAHWLLPREHVMFSYVV
jgi:glycylpeptide N-tetradecanoyltransferase